MVDFAGWDMPVQYPSGILAEHAAVREGAGLFDLSHMGRVYVHGPDALRLAQECTTRDLSRLRPGEAAYSVICDDDGGIIDDVIAYVLGEDEVLCVFNASNRLVDTDVFRSTLERLRLSAELNDRTLETVLIGVQGPKSQAILQAVTSIDLDALPGYAFEQHARVADAMALVSRTGYTGEDGFEILVAAGDAERVWHTLQQGGGAPAGLGARDTLRTEAGFALYGHDIDRTTHPYEARLGWVVDLRKPSFQGRAALERLKAAGPSRRLVGLRVETGAVPRPGFEIRDETGRDVGRVTSGTFSPTLRANIAMGYVPVALARPGQRLSVAARAKNSAAEVIGLPFIPHRSRSRAPS